MPRFHIVVLLAVFIASCSTDSPTPDQDSSTDAVFDDDNGITIDPPAYRRGPSVFMPDATDIGDYDAFYQQDNYTPVTVIRMDVRVANTVQGVCTESDQSGCTLDDVKADIDNKDDFTVDIPVHLSTAELIDTGEPTNAMLRQRGNSARYGAQKSFRIKLDSKRTLWRQERIIQLNKHPFDTRRMKNKLAFDLFQAVPHFPSLRTQFVNVWIDNGQGLQDYGLFTHVESIDQYYVKNRSLRDEDNLYKARFFRFSELELNALQVDEQGQPLSVDRFEEVLEIENGTDHRLLTVVIEALHDPQRTFSSVLDQHFNRNNVLTWLASNLIVRQADAVAQNFYLWNPQGTERLYFLPWDYDGTFEPEPELSNDITPQSLQRRLFYGFSRGVNSEFVRRWYQQPGAYELLRDAVEELRTDFYTDTRIQTDAQRLNEQIEPYVMRAPDDAYAIFEPRAAEGFLNAVRDVQQKLQTEFDIPMPPVFEPLPEVDSDGLLQLRWRPAFDVTRRHTLSYELLIASSPSFEAETVVFTEVGIDHTDVDDGLLSYALNTALLPQGRLYARLIARSENDPERVWQINSNVHVVDGRELYGAMAIDLTVD